MNPSSADPFPTFRKAPAAFAKAARALLRGVRLLRRVFFSRTSLKCYLITATLVCLTYTGLRWYGRRAWQAEKERVAALGLATDWKQLLTPMPPDEENFLAAPPFAGLFSPPYPDAPQLRLWFEKTYVFRPLSNGKKVKDRFQSPKEDTLAAWCTYFRKTGMLPSPAAYASPAAELLGDEPKQRIIQSIYAAAERPLARFPAATSWSIGLNRNGLFQMLESLRLNARAQLESGHVGEALKVFRVTNHLVRAFAAEPGYEHHMAPLLLKGQDPLLKLGITSHQWPATFLNSQLDEDYPELLQKSGYRGLEADRLYGSEILKQYQTIFSPVGSDSTYQRILWKELVPEYYFIRAAINLSRNIEILHNALRPLNDQESWAGRTPTLLPLRGIAGPLATCDSRLDPKGNLLSTYFYPIIQATLTHLAMALEIHYLSHHRYPATWDDLSPPLPAARLKDIDGQPIRYTTNPTGTWFTLTSTGADGRLVPPGHREDDLIFSTAPQETP